MAGYFVKPVIFSKVHVPSNQPFKQIFLYWPHNDVENLKQNNGSLINVANALPYGTKFTIYQIDSQFVFSYNFIIDKIGFLCVICKKTD